MQTIDYEAQAKAFLDRFGLMLTIGPGSDEPSPWTKPGEKHGLRHWVTLARRDRFDRSKAQQEIGFPFYGSISDKEKHRRLTAYSVLACLSSDVNTAESFEDFCADFGGDTDSRKALADFERCAEFARRLRAFFAADEREALAEIQ